MGSPSLEPAQESTVQLAVGLALLIIELGLVLAIRPVTFQATTNSFGDVPAFSTDRGDNPYPSGMSGVPSLSGRSTYFRDVPICDIPGLRVEFPISRRYGTAN